MSVDLSECFSQYNDEFMNFSLIEHPMHSRPDIAAFLLIDKLLPEPGREIINASSLDFIYLDADCEALSKVATEQDILTLVRCGVKLNKDVFALSMMI